MVRAVFPASRHGLRVPCLGPGRHAVHRGDIARHHPPAHLQARLSLPAQLGAAQQVTQASQHMPKISTSDAKDSKETQCDTSGDT